MIVPVSPLITNSFIDSCAFDPKYRPEDEASAEIFQLHRDGTLPIQIAHSTQKEIDHPKTPVWVKLEALSLIRTFDVQLTEGEDQELRKIQTVLAGNGKIENVFQDARHIFEAQKYGSYFITTDSRVLSRASKLLSFCNVTILRPSEFLAIVKQHLETQSHQPTNRSSTGSARPIPTQEVLYKGYVIRAVPYRLSESGQFTVNISIWRETGDTVTIHRFSSANTFKTEQEVFYHCIVFGQQIIDGKCDGCTVSD